MLKLFKRQKSNQADEYRIRISRLEAELRSLKKSLQKAEQTLSNVPIAIWRRSGNLGVDYSNNHFAHLLENSHDQILTDEGLEIHPNARDISENAQISGRIQQQNLFLNFADGKKYYHFNEIQALDGIVGCAFDITHQYELEAQMKRMQSSQTQMFEAMGSAMAVFDDSHELVDYNQSFAMIWRLEDDWLHKKPQYGELLDKLRERGLLPEQVNFSAFKRKQLEMFHNLIETHEELLFLPDGRSLRQVVLPNSAGGLIFIYEDITDRLTLERSYNTLLAVQKASLDNLREGVAVFAENGNLQLYNNEYRTIWDFEEDYLQKQPHIRDILEASRKLYICNDWSEEKKNWAGYVTDRQVQSGNITLANEKIYFWSITPLPDGANLLCYSDITDQQRVESSLIERNIALAEADKIKNNFLSNISYELRTPLTSIIGFCDFLSQGYAGELNEKQKDYIVNTQGAAAHLRQMIDSIIDLASIQAGVIELKKAGFAVDNLAKFAREKFLDRAKEKNIIFECFNFAGDMQYEGDEERLMQVVSHLLANAIKFTPPKGQVMLEIRPQDKYLILLVKDSGVGMSRQEQIGLFDNLLTTNRSSQSGAGIGLAMVKNYIALHNGKIEIDSQVGQGTVIRCYLPK